MDKLLTAPACEGMQDTYKKLHTSKKHSPAAHAAPSGQDLLKNSIHFFANHILLAQEQKVDYDEEAIREQVITTIKSVKVVEWLKDNVKRNIVPYEGSS
eukprot:1156751-Pelagomonas_calceolata.AAC.2